MNNDNLKNRHTQAGEHTTETETPDGAKRFDDRCPKCKHKPHKNYTCYVMMGETGSPHAVCCLCQSR